VVTRVGTFLTVTAVISVSSSLTLSGCVEFNNDDPLAANGPPKIEDIRALGSATNLKVGDEVELEVEFAYPVTLSGEVELSLDVGGEAKVARCDSIVASRVVKCTYVVEEGASANEIRVNTDEPFVSGKGEIQNSKGRAVPPKVADSETVGRALASVETGELVRLDAVPPRIIGIEPISQSGVYKLGDQIQFAVRFNEPVVFSGVARARLVLSSGADVDATCDLSSSDASLFLCSYQVGSSDLATALDILADGSFAAGFHAQGLSDEFGNIAKYRSNSSWKIEVPGSTSSARLSAKVVISVDGVPPSAPTGITLHEPASSPTTDTTPTLRVHGVTPGDTIQLFSTVGCSMPAFRTSAVVPAAASSIDLTSSALGSGSYQFSARAVDPAGNLSSCTAVGGAPSLTVDLNPLAIVDVSTSTANGVYSVGTTVSLQLVFSKSVFVTGTPRIDLNSGAYGVYVSGSGTETLSFAYAVSAGDGALDLDYSSGVDLDLNGGSIVDSSGAPSSLNLPFDGGTGYLARDHAIVIDTEAPSLTGLSNDSTPTRSKTWSWGCSEAAGCEYQFVIDQNVGTEPSGAYFSSTTTTQNSGDGVHYLHIRVRDPIGNASTVHHYSFVMDNTAPGSPVLAFVAGLSSPTSDSTPGFQVSALSTGDTVSIHTDASCSVGALRGSGVTAGPSIGLTSSALPDGSYTFYVQATDQAGNTSACVSPLALSVDTTPPAAPTSLVWLNPAVSPSNDTTLEIRVGGVTAGDTIEVFADDSCSLPTFKGSSVVAAASTSVDITTSALGDGVYFFYAQAVDAAGNRSPCFADGALTSMVVDTVAPALTGLANDGVPRTVKNWSWGCSQAPCQYEFVIDQSAGTEPSGGYFSGTSASQSSGDGVYFLHIRARDVAGNVSGVSHFSVTMDNTPPSVAVNQQSVQLDPTDASIVRFTVVFSEAMNSASFTAGDVTRTGTSTGGTWTIVQNSASLFTLELSAPFTEYGTVVASLGAGVASDLAGNFSLASTSTDNTVLVVEPRAFVGFQNPSMVVSEGGDGVMNYTSTIVMSSSKPYDVEVDYLLPAGGRSAVPGSDFSLSAGTVTIPQGQTSADISFSIIGDGVVETWSSRIFEIALKGTNSGAVLVGGKQSQRVLILEDDGVRDEFKVVDVGPSHACGITSSDHLMCWGANSYGQLGDGTNTDRSAPVSVDSSNTYSQVSVAETHTCAIMKVDVGNNPPGSSILKCWGQNNSGKLGDGTGVNRNVPTSVDVGTPTAQNQYRSVAAFGANTCGVTVDDQLRCWGSANRIGDPGITSDTMVPTGINTSVSYQMVHARYSNACAITSVGELRCWGLNTSGSLGVGDAVTKTSPTVVSSGTAFSKVFVGVRNSCAITSSGSLRCWGSGGYVGDGTSTQRNSPVTIDSGVNYSQVSVGDKTRCGVTTSGALKCWGQGLAGDGLMRISGGLSPQLIETGRSFSWVSLGFPDGSVVGYPTHCAISSPDSLLRCWGGNLWGSHGNGVRAQAHQPTQLDHGASFSSLDAGPSQTCGVTSSGDGLCWGYSGRGDGTPVALNATSYLRPVPARLDFLEGMTTVQSGNAFGCSLGVSGSLYCWGYNNNLGTVGNGNTGSDNERIQRVGGTETFTALSVGWVHSCALTTSGSVKCWGRNGTSQLGTGTAESHLTVPTAVSGEGTYSQVAVGSLHTCAILTTGKLQCWGGWIANGQGANAAVPTDVGTETDYTFVSAGDGFTCAIRSGGALYCWGYGDSGKLGAAGAPLSNISPLLIDSGTSYQRVSLGQHHACGITSLGVLKCWGRGEHGRLGTGTSSNQSTPVVIDSGVSYSNVSAGDRHTCATTTAAHGSVTRCWGDGESGQLGLGGGLPTFPLPVW